MERPSAGLGVARRLPLKEQKESCNILLRNLALLTSFPKTEFS